MGGHGHGHEPYEVPHASIYRLENAPKLKEVQEALARQGLKDPWLRNEVWRYDVKHFGTHAGRLRTLLFRGFPLGLGLCVATIGAEYALGLNDDGHGHGHGHGDGNGHENGDGH